MAYARPKGFRDPVHGLISIAPEDEFLIALIDTPEFQRLRRIRQLGVSSVTYPSAEHSRFSHSLGVMNFAQRILDELMRRYSGEQKICDLIREKAKVVKAAALLHDTGHGPFSHACERAFEAGKQHEERSQSIITAPESAIPRILREVAWIKPEEVRSLIGKGHPYPFLTDIVSSQLDADRMDYCCGMPWPQEFITESSMLSGCSTHSVWAKTPERERPPGRSPAAFALRRSAEFMPPSN